MIKMISVQETSKKFEKAARKAGLVTEERVTVRQWKKWQNQKGLAWANK